MAFTPDVDDALRWFGWTHDVEIGMGGARWRRVALPGPGGLGEQDARLMQTLDHLRHLANRLLLTEQQQQASDGRGELERFRRKHGRNG